MKVFGEPWDAPVYEEGEPCSTPVGETCLGCHESVEEGDRGVMIPHVTDGSAELRPWHAECFMRSVLGSPAHLAGRCRCSGRAASEGPEKSYRDEAREVWAQAMTRPGE